MKHINKIFFGAFLWELLRFPVLYLNISRFLNPSNSFFYTVLIIWMISAQLLIPGGLFYYIFSLRHNIFLLSSLIFGMALRFFSFLSIFIAGLVIKKISFDSFSRDFFLIIMFILIFDLILLFFLLLYRAGIDK